MKIRLSNIFAVLFTAMMIIGAFAYSAFAQTDSISYPIAELGGCSSKDECKAFCAEEANHDACTAFAQAHNVNGAGEVKSALTADGGPGGCATDQEHPVRACRDYCNDAAHIQECVDYAKSHNFQNGPRLQKAEKIASALANGATLPDGCTDGQSCKEVCKNPASVTIAQQCFDFGEAAGLLPEGATREKAEKLFSLVKGGDAPYKTLKGFSECNTTTDQEVKDRCIAFAEEHDLLPPRLIAVLKKTGGEGPGGCTDHDSCQTYCAEHRDECFTFAQQNDLLTDTQKARVAGGVAKLKTLFGNLPENAKSCVREALGDRFDGIENGTETSLPDDSDRVRKCVEAIRENGGVMNGLLPRINAITGRGTSTPQGTSPRRPIEKMQLTAQVRACVVEKLGEEKVQAIEAGTEVAGADIVRIITDCRHQFGVDLPTVPKPPSPPGGSTGAVVCTAEAKICPDGSSVGRVGPRCEFAKCPGEATTGGVTNRPCTTIDECRTFCANGGTATNPVLCREVLQKSGSTGTNTGSVSGSGSTAGTPPCTTADSCRVFCSAIANVTKEVCVKFHNGILPSTGGTTPPPPPTAVPGSDGSTEQPTSMITNPVQMTAALVFSIFFKN